MAGKQVGELTALGRAPKAGDLVAITDVDNGGALRKVDATDLGGGLAADGDGSALTVPLGSPYVTDLTLADEIKSGQVNVWRFKSGSRTLDGTGDWAAAIQDGIDEEVILYFPPGTYAVASAISAKTAGYVRLRGAGYKLGGNEHRSRIVSQLTSQVPLFHFGAHYELDGDYVSDTPNTGTGKQVRLEDIYFSGTDANAQFMFAPNCSSSWLRRCTVAFPRGLCVSQGFDWSVEDCVFSQSINSILAGDYSDANLEKYYALAIASHGSVRNLSFKGCATGLIVGTQCAVSNSRFEEGGIAMVIGKGFGFDTPGYGTAGGNYFAAGIRDVRTEGNIKGAVVYSFGGAASMEGCSFYGSGTALGGSAKIGLEIVGATRGGSYMNNISVSGNFVDAPLKDWVGYPINYLSVSQSTSTSAKSYSTAGGLSKVGSDNHPNFAVINHPISPGLEGAWDATRRKLVAFSNLQLRGLKGLDVVGENIQPNNFGRIETLGSGVSSLAVAFSSTNNFSGLAFTAENDGASTLTPGTYWYFITYANPRGVGGISIYNTSQRSSVVVGSGQRGKVTFGGSGPSDRKIRIYRGPSEYEYRGYFEVAVGSSPFLDTGQAFTALEGPPLTVTDMANQQEADTNYAIIALPSWETTCWVTSKATSGFTLNFGVPTPDSSQTVQWLLFRA